MAGLGREGRNCVEEILRRCGEQKLFGGDVSRIDKRYLRLLKRLKALPDKAFLETYMGVDVDNDAQEGDIEKRAAKEKLFPIGYEAIDGLSYVAESGRIYTLVRDSAFLSGDCVEDYCNTLVGRNKKTKQML